MGSRWPDGGAPPLWPWGTVLRTLAGDELSAVLRADEQRSDTDRFARFSAVLDVVAGRAGRSPVAIVLDDAHLADTAALLLVRFLLKGSTGDRPRGGRAARSRGRRTSSDASISSRPTRSGAGPRRVRRSRDSGTASVEHPEPEVADELAAPLVRLTGGNPLLLARAAGRRRRPAT